VSEEHMSHDQLELKLTNLTLEAGCQDLM